MALPANMLDGLVFFPTYDVIQVDRIRSYTG